MTENDRIKLRLLEEMDALFSRPLAVKHIRKFVYLYQEWLDDINAQQEELDKRLELAELKLAQIKSLLGEDDATEEFTE